MTDYLYTEDGGKFFFESPEINSYGVEEIGACLAKLCRYGGMIPYFYSVAQHSVFVSEIIEDMGLAQGWKNWPRYSMLGLLHDANEHGYVDVPSPLKRIVGQKYYDLKERCEKEAFLRFGLYDDFVFFKDILHNVDVECRKVETAYIRSTEWPQDLKWVIVREDSVVYQRNMQWEFAFSAFLDRYEFLKEKMKLMGRS